MVIETVPKDILDKINDTIAVTQSGSWSITVIDEWKNLVDNGLVITKSVAQVTTATTIYTVPVDKIFYLVSANLDVDIITSVTASRGATMETDLSGSSVPILRIGLGAIDADRKQFSITQSFPLPLRLTAGKIIKIVPSSTLIEAGGHIQGYEVDA